MKEHGVELEMPEQNANLLEQRYNKTIKKTMNKWAGYYKKAKTPLKSGWTEEMYRKHACELYNVGEGSAFKLAHCVDILQYTRVSYRVVDLTLYFELALN
jgi:hypothetical protein